MLEEAHQEEADFSSPDALPEKAFFSKDYLRSYQRQINELIKRMEFLLEEVSNLEVENENEPSTEWHGLQLTAIAKDTVWQNLTALQDFDETLRSIADLFKQKIRESIGIVATNPDQFTMERTLSNSSMTQSLGNSEYSNESQDEEEEVGFQDVVPVKRKKEAHALNDAVTERVKVALGNDPEEFERFKAHAFNYGTGLESAELFYEYLSDHINIDQLHSIIMDFARLLPQDAVRIPLLKAHYARMEYANGQHPDLTTTRHKSYSSNQSSNSSFENADVDDEYDSEDDKIDEFPSTLRLNTLNHLVFIIHGIGQHIDFKDGEHKSWNGETGVEGGNHYFRDMFRTMLETMFRDIPVALEMQSIEWHEDLHEPTGVDSVFDLISPEGSTSIREFSKETLMDVMYYLSPRYGQLIIDSVTEQLNQKYRVFMEEHPGWNGKASIFAHSLGSVIAYDILTHKAGEVAKNGVRFPGLDFEVDIFFAAGSPVPVMILGRGDLNIEDGVFTAGIKTPKCRRYLNIFHPIDPIAYRVEPLIKHEMHDKEPVQLIPAHSVRGLSYGKIQEMLEAITGPVHGFQYRHDYVMKRRAREKGVMELAFATSSHSSYWMSEDVVLFAIMQICQPVVEKLQRYMSSRKPLPTLMRNIVELTPHTKVMLSAIAFVRDRCTGLSREQIVIIDRERLYILDRVNEVACRRKWRVELSPTSRAIYGEDSFTLKVVPHDISSPPRTAGSFSPARLPPPTSGSSLSQVRVLKAPTTPIRNEWMGMINEVVLKHAGNPETQSREKHLAELPSGMCMDYFNAVKSGFLQEKTLKGWYEGWNNRWIVLKTDSISCYENSPRLEFSSQFKLRKTKVMCYQNGYLFRIVSRTGTSIEMRVKDQATFNVWVNAFEQVPTAQVIHYKDLLENSPCAVFLTSDGSGSNEAPGRGEWLRTKIEGYEKALDANGQQYAAFVIIVTSTTAGTTVVQRRYSEFAKLHRQLRQIIPHEQLPSLPGTRMWGKFDPTYLKEKAIGLHGYLNEVCKRCANTRAQPYLLDFLELPPPESVNEGEV